jgi:predicted CoA-binding protein
MSNLDFVFKPNSVAIVGASTKLGSVGNDIAKNLTRDFAGAVYPVNPKAEELYGLKCYPNLTAIKAPIDFGNIVKNKKVTMVIEDISSILRQEAEAVLNIPVVAEYNEAVTLIVEYVHNRNGKLITSGMGKAGQIASNLATTFSSTGTPAFFLHPSEAQHGDLGIVRDNDIMLLISNSGKTRELIELTRLTLGLAPDMKFWRGNPM